MEHLTENIDPSSNSQKLPRQEAYKSLEGNDAWSVEDIADQIPQDLRKILSNSEGSLLEEPERVRKVANDFVNGVTRGQYFDTRNLNHMLGVNSESEKTLEFFSADSVIDPQAWGGVDNRAMWFSSGANPYLRPEHLDKPIMIMTPKGPGRNFVRGGLLTEASISEESFLKRLEETSGPAHLQVDSFGGSLDEHVGSGHVFNHLFFLANYPFISRETSNKVLSIESGGRFVWKDVFDTIVDMKVGKVFRRILSAAEIELANVGIEGYRKLLRERFNIDLSGLDNLPLVEQKKISGREALRGLWSGLSPEQRLLAYEAVFGSKNLSLRNQDELDRVAAGDPNYMVASVVQRMENFLHKKPDATLADIEREIGGRDAG